MTHKIFSRRKVGLPASRSTRNRTPTPAARANCGRVSPSRLRAKRNALPSCLGDRMDIHSSVNLPFGLLLDNLSFAKDIFPDRDFFSQRFHY